MSCGPYEKKSNIFLLPASHINPASGAIEIQTRSGTMHLRDRVIKFDIILILMRQIINKMLILTRYLFDKQLRLVCNHN